MFYKDLFGARLRKIRKAAKEPQGTVAELLGVSATQVSDMEAGNSGTTLERLSILCRHFHVSSDYLLGLTDDPAPHNWKADADAT